MNYTSTMRPKTTERPLPKGWRWVRLSDVCNIIMGQSPPGNTYKKIPDGLPFFQGKADFGSRHPIAKVWCVEPTRIAKPGDILLSVRAPVGPTNVADVECCIGRGLAAIQPKDQADKEFILLALKCREDFLIELGSGSTFEAIRKDDLFDLEIPFPPLDEQRRIAKRLNEQQAAVESARKAAEEQLQAANALRAAYIRQFIENQVFQKWPTVKLGELLVETRNGLYKLEKFYGRGKRILKMYNIGRLDGTWNLERVDLIDVTESEYNNYRLVAGDILLNRVNSRELVGKSAVINEKTEGAVFESKNIRVRVDNTRVLPDFVATYMNSKYGRVQFERRLKQIVGQATINRSDLVSFEFPLPPYNVQQKIISELKSKQIEIDDLESALESQLAEINRLPASLLWEAFAGRI